MRVALITGSTRNIGLAIARRLAADGATVVVNGRDGAAAEQAAGKLRATGLEAVAYACDISDRDAVRSMVAEIGAQVGPVDILVNNAVMRHHGSVEETDVEDWRQVLRVVLDGAFHTSQAVLGGMAERGWGRIVNIAGLAGQMGAPGRISMVTAKSGLMGLTRAIAMEFAHADITCNTVSPGITETTREFPPGQEDRARAFYAAQAAEVPVGRLGTTEEMAAICSYLCSEEAGFTTGQTFGINGGRYLWS